MKMMNSIAKFLIATISPLVLVSYSQAQVSTPQTPYEKEKAAVDSFAAGGYQSMTVDGIRRSYRHDKSWISSGEAKRPLVIVLHGNEINANVALLSTGFDSNENVVVGLNAFDKDEKCDLRNFIQTPTPQDCYSWDVNSLPEDNDKKEINDGDFILAVIEHVLKTDSRADKDRVYVFGESGGGFIVLRNFCKLASSGKVAAVGVSAALPRVRDKMAIEGGCRDASSKKRLNTAMPYIHIHGTKDTNVSYMGYAYNQPDEGRLGAYAHSSVKDTLDAFDDFNKVEKSNGTTRKQKWNLPRMDYTTPTRVQVESSVRQGRFLVRHLKVIGGTHLLPGLFPNHSEVRKEAITLYKSKFPETQVNLDINAADELMKFFNMHTLSSNKDFLID
jgi:poly(3-hydroxybutyrate) depolymerase